MDECSSPLDMESEPQLVSWDDKMLLQLECIVFGKKEMAGSFPINRDVRMCSLDREIDYSC